MRALYYGIGIGLAIAMGVAVGQDIVREHGTNRKNLTIIAACTLALGVLLGWALESFIAYLQFARSARY